MAPRVDVGVVTWNTAELTADSLRRLLDSDQGCDLRILVHDNASSDGTPEALKERVPEVDIEVSAQNLGFAGGVNRLIRRSDSPWFFMLNSDAWPEPGALSSLVETAQRHPRCAAAAPLLRRVDGSVEHSTHRFPSIGVALLDAAGGRRWMPHRVLEHLCLEGAWMHDRPTRVDWAVGAALLVRKAALDDLGGFDERFFMYVEDLEWCWRARRSGWEVRFDPTAVVRHVGNASGAQLFGNHRAALEAANLRTFCQDVHHPAWVAAHRSLTAFSAGSRAAAAHLRGDGAHEEYWRSQAIAALGWAEGPRIDDDADSFTEATPVALEDPDHGPQKGPKVSVAVSSYRRAHLLPRLMAALEAQTLPKDQFEVIVVDNASPDDTTQVLDRLVNECTFKLRPLRASEQRGPAGGRNLAWRASLGPIVAFTDDDCVPAPNWLEVGLAALDGHARVVVGRTVPPQDQLALTRRSFARVLSVDDVRFFETCNIFYRRSDLMRVGGFDETFTQPAGEDTDLALRVLERGVEPIFVPNALVCHDVRRGSFVDALRESTRWTDIPCVLRRHPSSRKTLLHRWIFWKASHPPTILAAVGLVASLSWRPSLILAIPWIRFRLSSAPVAPGPRRRVAALPGALAIDLAEVAVMLRGSFRHRTLVL